MTVLEVLSEMIGSEKFLGLVALAKLVHVGKVVYSAIPIRLRVVGKLFTAESAGVVEGATRALRGGAG
jgi:hypothetical protein